MNQSAPSIRQLMKRAQNAIAKQNGDDALACLQQVLALNPTHTEALYNMGFIFQGASLYPQATEYYQRALESDPNHVDSYLMMAKLYEAQARGDEAIQVARLASQIAPNNPRTHNELCNQLIRFNQAHLAVMYLDQILPLFPKDQNLHQIYTMALKINNRFEDADRAYQKFVTEFRPSPAARLMYESYLPRIYRSAEEIDRSRENFKKFLERFIAEKVTLNIESLRYIPIFQLAFDNRDNKELLQLFTKMLRSVARELNFVAPHCKAALATRGDKIRIGFVSHNMHNHSVGNCYRGVMISLAQQPDMDVTFFNLNNVIDDKIQEIANAGVPIVQLTKSAVINQRTLANRKLDIIIYPDIGMDMMTHYLAMSRLAPYQVAFEGHPETTGIDTIDYMVSSRSYEPPHADENYTERLLCTDGIDTIFRRPQPPRQWLSRADLQLPEDKKLYICPMAIQKFHPDFDDVLADILAQDPNGMLVLFNDFQQASASALLQQRIMSKCDPSRIIFMQWLPMEVLFSVMKQADALLDTIYFGGGTTIQYAFNFGIPVVTMPGHYARGRVVYSYYTLMGINDAPIARDVKEYARTAVKLANDKAYAERLHQEILERNKALFEAAPYAPRIVQLVHDIMDQNLDAYKR